MILIDRAMVDYSPAQWFKHSMRRATLSWMNCWYREERKILRRRTHLETSKGCALLQHDGGDVCCRRLTFVEGESKRIS